MTDGIRQIQMFKEVIGPSCAGALNYRRAMGKMQRKCERIKSRAVEDQWKKQDVRRRSLLIGISGDMPAT